MLLFSDMDQSACRNIFYGSPFGLIFSKLRAENIHIFKAQKAPILLDAREKIDMYGRSRYEEPNAIYICSVRAFELVIPTIDSIDPGILRFPSSAVIGKNILPLTLYSNLINRKESLKIFKAIDKMMIEAITSDYSSMEL